MITACLFQHQAFAILDHVKIRQACKLYICRFVTCQMCFMYIRGRRYKCGNHGLKCAKLEVKLSNKNNSAAKCASYDGTESYLKVFMPVSL